ncbi:MAG: F0F1 ATP synthase subunit B [Clostridiales bacterium]|nr:F0F1 ATP synthase subunit B [Clostridiales bacterium]
MINMYSMILLAEDAAEESSLFSADQMGGYAATILLTVFNVILVYIFFKLVLFKPILGVIKKREEQINANVENAAKSETEAAANAEQSKQAIADARAEASQILEDARADAEDQAKIIKMKAKEEADEILERAQSEVLRMKKVSIEQMKDEISDLAVEVAGRVIGDVVEHDKLKDLAVKHTEEMIGEEVDSLGE